MHNKSWIADNRLAIVGGRNLGDEYFGATDEVNFVDLDFAMVGPVVRTCRRRSTATGTRRWPTRSSVLDPDAVNGRSAWSKLRGVLQATSAEAAQGRYAAAREVQRRDRAHARGRRAAAVVAAAMRFAADDPLKLTLKEGDVERSAGDPRAAPALQGARREMTIISPYFVPGGARRRCSCALPAPVSTCGCMTNSLAANDVAAVHGGYSRYRGTLLDGGVKIWELKPLANKRADVEPARLVGASLHTKALAVDAETLFVGSFNLDPRSAFLNCEQGVLVSEPVLAAQLRAIFDHETEGTRAWRVTSARTASLLWSDGSERHTSEPNAGWWRRFQAAAARLLHLDANL